MMVMILQTGAASTPPLTACANSDLSHQLAEAFDENRDGQLSAEVGMIFLLQLIVLRNGRF